MAPPWPGGIEGIVPTAKFGFDFFDGPRAEVVGIGADIEAVAVRRVVETTMHMAEQMPGIPPGTVPFAHRIVAQHEAVAAGFDLPNEAYAGKKPGVMGERFVIVIAGDEMNVAIKAGEIDIRTTRIAEAEVTKVIHTVAAAHARIPARDQGLVHFRDRGEGPVARLDDIPVPEMCIGGEENRHVLR